MSGVPAGAWMQENLSRLGSRTLRELCVPGSHDAGMSEYVPGTAGTTKCNTLTQKLRIGEQLRCGARYFDIRPVITGNDLYRCGHYSESAGMWHGANGQSIASIVEEINAFTATHNELVVLYLSHDLNTNLGRTSYAPLTQGDWDYLLGDYLIKNLKHLFSRPNPPGGVVDLSKMTLNELIGQPQPAVVVIVDPSGPLTMGYYANQGFYTKQSFSVVDQYSDTNDLETMMTGQVSKMRQYRTSPQSPLFLLSWTLTQSAVQAMNCSTGAAKSIHDLADEANPKLYSKFLDKCTAQCFPNILHIDYLDTPDVAAMAMAVNWLT